MRGSKGLGGLGGCITVYPPGPLLTVQAPTCPTGTGPKLGPAPSSSAGGRNVPYCPSSCSPDWHRPQVQAGASSPDGQLLTDADSSQLFRLVTAWLAPVRARPAPVRARPTPVSGPGGGQNCWQPAGAPTRQSAGRLPGRGPSVTGLPVTGVRYRKLCPMSRVRVPGRHGEGADVGPGDHHGRADVAPRRVSIDFRDHIFGTM